jgi:hypothetical protein
MVAWFGKFVIRTGNENPIQVDSESARRTLNKIGDAIAAGELRQKREGLKILAWMMIQCPTPFS